MKAGDKVYTPRFCTVQIEKVYDSRREAYKNGYTEPTYYENENYGVMGKSIDLYHMEFAGYKVYNMK